MIEINIPYEAAASLLKDQVNIEFKRQKRTRLIDYGITLSTLNENKFKEIVELALFDIILLLPVQVITEESNLTKIMVQAIRTLSHEFNNEFLANYTEEKAQKFLLMIRKSFGDFSKTTTFQNN